LNNREALKLLYAYQQYLQACENGKQIYGPGYFKNILKNAEEYLKKPADHTVDLFRKNECVICGGPLPKTTMGDHLIALALNGKDVEYNKVPLCENCNKSKGKKDLLDWWFSKHHKLLELDPYVLAVYLKNKYRYFQEIGLLNEEADFSLEIAWIQAKNILGYLFKRYRLIFENKFKGGTWIEDQNISEKRRQIFEYLSQNEIIIGPLTMEWFVFKGIEYVKSLPLEKLEEMESKLLKAEVGAWGM